ncbi:hypothetical protein DM860_006371 [Cuscuta australis]|uniref:Uncharacterized protein n=1 Tax=Cuscuta australis TaxID=267555 RepID=A0A328D7K0_9ASTE|nr:hypothetical protein DM860_006371 [Cuscuta australis]
MEEATEQKKKSETNKVPVLPWMRSPVDISVIDECPLNHLPFLDPSSLLCPFILYLSLVRRRDVTGPLPLSPPLTGDINEDQTLQAMKIECVDIIDVSFDINETIEVENFDNIDDHGRRDGHASKELILLDDGAMGSLRKQTTMAKGEYHIRGRPCSNGGLKHQTEGRKSLCRSASSSSHGIERLTKLARIPRMHGMFSFFLLIALLRPTKPAHIPLRHRIHSFKSLLGLTVSVGWFSVSRSCMLAAKGTLLISLKESLLKVKSYFKNFGLLTTRASIMIWNSKGCGSLEILFSLWWSTDIPVCTRYMKALHVFDLFQSPAIQHPRKAEEVIVGHPPTSITSFNRFFLWAERHRRSHDVPLMSLHSRPLSQTKKQVEVIQAAIVVVCFLLNFSYGVA